MLLESGRVKVDGHETVDGRDAVRLVSTTTAMTDSAGKKYGTVYLVDAKTGDPVEWRTTLGGQEETLRFAAYEELPPTQENLALLSLAKQHPGAQLDTDVAHYEQAWSRLSSAFSPESVLNYTQ